MNASATEYKFSNEHWPEFLRLSRSTERMSLWAMEQNLFQILLTYEPWTLAALQHLKDPLHGSQLGQPVEMSTITF